MSSFLIDSSLARYRFRHYLGCADFMARLFRLDSSGGLVTATEQPFTDEVSEMEPFIKSNAKLLGDVFIFGEQTVSSGRDKRTDLLAVNKDGEVIIIELKKGFVDASIFSQILGYKNYWRKHPDAAKNLWQTAKEKPEGIEPDWVKYNPKLTVVASAFDPEVLEVSAGEGLGITFVEITRYRHDDSTFVVVDEPETAAPRERPVSSQDEYNWDWYADKVAFTEGEVDIAKRVHDGILALCIMRDWKVFPKFNKGYVSFKQVDRNRNAFWLEFRHKGKVLLGVNRRDEESDPSGESDVKWHWDKNWGWWYTEIDSPDFDLSKIEPVLESAYHETTRA